MPKFLVTWEVEVEADGPAHAASIAHTLQRVSKKADYTFVVTAENGHTTAVRLQGYAKTE